VEAFLIGGASFRSFSKSLHQKTHKHTRCRGLVWFELKEIFLNKFSALIILSSYLLILSLLSNIKLSKRSLFSFFVRTFLPSIVTDFQSKFPFLFELIALSCLGSNVSTRVIILTPKCMRDLYERIKSQHNRWE